MRKYIILTAILVLSAVAAGLTVHGCNGGADKVRITAGEQPTPFKSLGKTDVYVRIEGTGNRLTDIAFPLRKRDARWFLPSSLRLAVWDDETESYRIILESAWDANTEMMSGQVDEDGIYTVFGLSRSEKILGAQLSICSYLKTSPGDTIPASICNEILCAPMNFMEWSVDWEVLDSTITPDTLMAGMGNICGECIGGGLTFADFPECILFEAPLEAVPDLVMDGFLDNDQDGLSNSHEYAIQTDPDNPDSDGDGLQDGWEVLGYDFDGDGDPDIDLAGMGVDPNHLDILVEIDWMYEDRNRNDAEDPMDVSYKPQQPAIDYVVQAFASAPVQNRDGVNGINLIINVSNGMKAIDLVDRLLTSSSTPNGPVTFSDTYYRIKDGYNIPVSPGYVPGEMEEGMAGISRYCLWIAAWDTEESSGLAEWPGPSDDFVVSMGAWDPPASLDEQKSVFMHELGHTLGLYHSGSAVPGATAASDHRFYEVHYPSVMNFYHYWHGVNGTWHFGADPAHIDGCQGIAEKEGHLCFVTIFPRAITFSAGLLPPVDETNLSEPAGIAILGPDIDFNGNGDTTETGIALDLEGHGLKPQPHTDNNDWESLLIRFW